MSAGLVADRVRGTIASLVIVTACLVVCLSMPMATLNGPIAVFVLCAQPTLIVLDGVWAGRTDGWLSARTRPGRGLILLAVVLVAGAVVELIVEPTVGGAAGVATPEIAMFGITSVVSAFWLTNICQMWPFVLIRNAIVRTIALILSSYAVALAVYYGLFDASALPSVGSATPHGLIDAWYILAFLVAFVSGMFLGPAFGFWGLDRLGAPARAVASTLLCLVWGGLILGIGALVAPHPVATMIWFPVAVLFGGIIVLVVLRGSLVTPLRSRAAHGAVTMLVVIALGVALVALARHLLVLVNPDVTWAAPGYAGYIWLANASLAFTFPILAVHANLFGLWPLQLDPQSTTGEPMPHVHVSIREGRGPEAVRTLIHNVTAAVVDSLGSAPETVRVVVTEVPATHWANGDVTLEEKAAAQGAGA